MISWLKWFRKFLIINASVVSAATLTFALLTIVIFVLFQGLSYFSVKDVVAVDVEGEMSPVLAIVKSRDIRNNRISIEYYSPTAKQMQSERIISFDGTSTPAQSAWIIRLNSGGQIFARDVNLSLPHHDILDKQGAIETQKAQLAENLEQLNTIQQALYPLELEYARYIQQNIEDTAPIFIRLNQRIDVLLKQRDAVQGIIEQTSLTLSLSDNSTTALLLKDVADIWQPGKMSVWQKWTFSLQKIGDFILGTPGPSSQIGGIFPALYGTVLMVFIMTLIVTPLGVLTAIYLSEYANDSKLISFIRIIITNLAGIPSIVFGVFGLGFFIHFIGVSVDQWFFAEALPSPTFGTPGLLWAALTMALMTLPVVIVATEEGLRQVPKIQKYGALALGATQYEMVKKIIIPRAAPAILTGVILAMARAASEVAPLLLVGAVVYAPTLPIDGQFPYIHLERQFMHLGVLIFDGVFHSQIELSEGSVLFATCAVLITIVILLNASASWMRYRLKQRLVGE